MRSLNIKLSDLEYAQWGLDKSTLSFSELIEIVGRTITRQSLEKSIQLAEKYGLSKMTMEEIDKEIKSYRDAEIDP